MRGPTVTALLALLAVIALAFVARSICQDIARTRGRHRGGWLR